MRTEDPFIEKLCAKIDKAVADSKTVDYKQLSIEMDAQIRNIVNNFEIATGHTVCDLEIHRVNDDHLGAVTNVKPFIFFSVPNRQYKVHTKEHHRNTVCDILIDETDNSVHTLDDNISYAVCLNLDLPNPDNPELIIMSGKTIRAALEDATWVTTGDE